MNEKYRQCTRCLMDTSDLNIEFNKYGICNHCKEYDRKTKMFVVMGSKGQEKLERTCSNNETVNYLMSAANTFYQWAIQHSYLERYKEAAITLGFVVSYSCFAQYYKKHAKVITLSELLDITSNDVLLNSLHYSKGGQSLTFDDINNLLKDVAVMIETYSVGIEKQSSCHVCQHQKKELFKRAPFS